MNACKTQVNSEFDAQTEMKWDKSNLNTKCNIKEMYYSKNDCSEKKNKNEKK